MPSIPAARATNGEAEPLRLRPSGRAGRYGAAGLSAFGILLLSLPAEAHVKWFAPYIVGAPPAPVSATLTNLWFWTGLALVLVFFVATRVVERSRVGETILSGLDRASDPLWNRLDDFVRVVIAAFFVAIFAVRRRLPDPRPQDPRRVGVLDPVADRGGRLLPEDHAAFGRRHHRPMAAGAAGLRFLSPARLPRPGRRGRRLPGA